MQRLQPSALGVLALAFGSLPLGCTDSAPEVASHGGTAAAFGDSGTGGTPGGAGSGATSGAGGTHAAGSGGPSVAGSGGQSVGCESGILCGDGACCESGEECVLSACLAACPSQIRCGAALEVCCDAADVCVSDSCVTPGVPCLDWADCGENEFCEPTLEQCLPQPAEGPECEYRPPVGPLTPVIEWSWEATTIQPSHVQVINMPVVIDLEKDGTPDVVIVTSDNYSGNGVGYLRALDGATGLEKWDAASDVYLDANRVHPRGTPAAADIDGDGNVEIVVPKANGGLIAFEHTGAFKWATTVADGSAPYVGSVGSSPTVAIADLEGDGTPEIVAGGHVFESTGRLRFNKGSLEGANNYYGPVSIVANLDGSGPQEVFGGRRAYRSDGTPYWDNGAADGYPAIADLDLDGTPEVVVIANGTVRVQHPETGVILASLGMPASGRGGPPTIADFDNDGVPEIASANGGAYVVFEYVSTPTPTLSPKWDTPTQDLSSNATGSSVFDFQGDGAAEVVYNDECAFRVYDGTNGDVLYEINNPSATILEYPVIVDVDGDNNTEIVLTANDLFHVSGSLTCSYDETEFRHGVFVYGDAGDNWVRTRKLWNQHAYHITNIGSAGDVPAPEAASWIAPTGFNNYRQSNQGAGVFNAPDLQVSLEASLVPCPDAIRLRASVTNRGSLGVAAGIPATFFLGTAPNGTFIGTVNTTGSLLPGQFEVVEIEFTLPPGSGPLDFYVVVDGGATGLEDGAESECLEDNNAASLQKVECDTPF
jgi:hypothetical protein